MTQTATVDLFASVGRRQPEGAAVTHNDPSNVTLKPSPPYPANPETGEPINAHAHEALEAWKKETHRLQLPDNHASAITIDLGRVPIPPLFFESDATNEELDELARLARVKAQSAALAVLATTAHNYAAKVENGVA